MKFFKFLRHEEEWNPIKEKLLADCKPFLNDMGGFKEFLYRGVSRRINNIEQLSTRKDRSPKDTKEKAHNQFDEFFKKRYGWKARSENVIFAFGSSTPAINYGKPYLVFPIGSYEYLWSEHIFDLTNTLSAFAADWVVTNMGAEYLKPEFMQKFNEHEEYDKFLKEFKTEFLETYQKGRSGDKGIYEAAKSRNEVMVHCDKYYLVDVKFQKHIQKELHV